MPNRKSITIFTAFDFPERWKKSHPEVKFQFATLKKSTKGLPGNALTNKTSNTEFPNNVFNSAEVYLTLLSQPIRKPELEKFKNLRLLGTYSAGLNHLDLQAIKNKSIRLFNTPEVLTQATAELTFCLLLSVSRRLTEGQDYLRRGVFTKTGGWKPELLLGQSLRGKNAVLVGKGRIGKETSKLFKTIGLRIEFISKKSSPHQIKQILRRAQILSFHCPLNETTRNWLNQTRINLLPKDAIVLNTARGEIIDEKALAEALLKKKIFGVGLDVYEKEPKIHPKLLKCKNAVLLPHLGSATEETRQAMFDAVVNSLKDAYFSSKFTRRHLWNEVR